MFALSTSEAIDKIVFDFFFHEFALYSFHVSNVSQILFVQNIYLRLSTMTYRI